MDGRTRRKNALEGDFPGDFSTWIQIFFFFIGEQKIFFHFISNFEVIRGFDTSMSLPPDQPQHN
jgi:hypothetical protein